MDEGVEASFLCNSQTYEGWDDVEYERSYTANSRLLENKFVKSAAVKNPTEWFAFTESAITPLRHDWYTILHDGWVRSQETKYMEILSIHSGFCNLSYVDGHVEQTPSHGPIYLRESKPWAPYSLTYKAM